MTTQNYVYKLFFLNLRFISKSRSLEKAMKQAILSNDNIELKRLSFCFWCFSEMSWCCAAVKSIISCQHRCEGEIKVNGEVSKVAFHLPNLPALQALQLKEDRFSFSCLPYGDDLFSFCLSYWSICWHLATFSSCFGYWFLQFLPGLPSLVRIKFVSQLKEEI